MLTGTIKFFNKPKGFGFITSDAGGKEVFLPSATVTASGIKKVEPGLRVSFQEEADVKGPKAVALALLDEPRVAVAPRPPQPQAAQAPAAAQAAPQRASTVVLYYDPASTKFEAVRDALAEQNIEPELVDYTAVPPTPEELKKWSLALTGSDAGLVRRSDPMFFALQLDDRFISENDFWLAVSLHPKLINGPILRMAGRLTICKSSDDVRRFLGLTASAAKPKVLSARLSALIRGEALPPVEEPEELEEFDDEETDEDVAVIEAPPVAERKKTLVPKRAETAKPAAKPKTPAVKKKAVVKAKPTKR